MNSGCGILMRIKIDPRANKQLEKLKRNPQLVRRFREAFRAIAADPFSGKSLEGDFEGIHSWRVGEYRILYQIIQNELTVLILRVAPRSEVYR